MADRLKTLQEQKKDLEAQTKALGAEIAELDEQLSDAMTEAELDRFSRNGSTFYLKSRLFASPASDRKDEMMQALKDNGYGSLVVETVNANTLASFIGLDSTPIMANRPPSPRSVRLCSQVQRNPRSLRSQCSSYLT